jgi:hypothetical protein
MKIINSPLHELGPVDDVVAEFPAGANTFLGRDGGGGDGCPRAPAAANLPNLPDAIPLLAGTVSTHLGRDELPVELPGHRRHSIGAALARR